MCDSRQAFMVHGDHEDSHDGIVVEPYVYKALVIVAGGWSRLSTGPWWSWQVGGAVCLQGPGDRGRWVEPFVYRALVIVAGGLAVCLQGLCDRGGWVGLLSTRPWWSWQVGVRWSLAGHRKSRIFLRRPASHEKIRWPAFVWNNLKTNNMSACLSICCHEKTIN